MANRQLKLNLGKTKSKQTNKEKKNWLQQGSSLRKLPVCCYLHYCRSSKWLIAWSYASYLITPEHTDYPNDICLEDFGSKELLIMSRLKYCSSVHLGSKKPLWCLMIDADTEAKNIEPKVHLIQKRFQNIVQPTLTLLYKFQSLEWDEEPCCASGNYIFILIFLKWMEI